MSGPFTSKIAGVSMVLAMSAAPMVSASVPRTEHCEIRVVPTPSRELTFSAKPERSISFAATAVSSTTPETLEEIMKTIQTSDRPWSRRLSKLHAVDRVSNKNLVGLVEMLQTSDSEHWPAPGIFPGEDGGLRFEWREGRSHATFEVDDRGSMYAYFFDFAHDSEADIEPTSIDDAVRFLREHLV